MAPPLRVDLFPELVGRRKRDKHRRYEGGFDWFARWRESGLRVRLKSPDSTSTHKKGLLAQLEEHWLGVGERVFESPRDRWVLLKLAIYLNRT